jgi:hypothetical protein
LNEQIPKLKIVSPNFKFRMTNQVSDYETGSETLIGVKNEVGFGMSSMSRNTILNICNIAISKYVRVFSLLLIC